MNCKDLEGLSELCRRVDVDILMSERIRDAQEYVPMIQMKATDRLRGNFNQGGITGVMKVAHLAEAHGMNCEIHNFTNMLEAASLHVALAINNCEFFEQGVPEGVFDERIYPGLFKNVIRVDRNGYVHAPTKSGLGYDIDLEVAEKISAEKFKI